MIIPTRVTAGLIRVGDCDAPAVTVVGSNAFARPKSSTLTVPSARTLILAGFRSRWMMPCSCAASSASAICLRDRQRLVERNRTSRDAVREGRPSTNSMTSALIASALFQAVDGARCSDD